MGSTTEDEEVSRIDGKLSQTFSPLKSLESMLHINIIHINYYRYLKLFSFHPNQKYTTACHQDMFKGRMYKIMLVTKTLRVFYTFSLFYWTKGIDSILFQIRNNIVIKIQFPCMSKTLCTFGSSFWG